MYGTFSGMTFGLVALVALGVIAFAFLASPLIAVIIAAIIAVGLLIGMAALRQLSGRNDDVGHRHRRRGGGEPASGEG